MISRRRVVALRTRQCSSTWLIPRWDVTVRCRSAPHRHPRHAWRGPNGLRVLWRAEA